jgi:hypothetical protein
VSSFSFPLSSPRVSITVVAVLETPEHHAADELVVVATATATLA